MTRPLVAIDITREGKLVARIQAVEILVSHGRNMLQLCDWSGRHIGYVTIPPDMTVGEEYSVAAEAPVSPSSN